MTHPDEDDVVVRQKRGNPSTVYVLHTTAAPDQFLLCRTRDEAGSQALAFAKYAHVSAWFTNDEDDFVLLGTFRKDKVESARSSSWRSQHK